MTRASFRKEGPIAEQKAYSMPIHTPAKLRNGRKFKVLESRLTPIMWTCRARRSGPCPTIPTMSSRRHFLSMRDDALFPVLQSVDEGWHTRADPNIRAVDRMLKRSSAGNSL